MAESLDNWLVRSEPTKERVVGFVPYSVGDLSSSAFSNFRHEEPAERGLEMPRGGVHLVGPPVRRR